MILRTYLVGAFRYGNVNFAGHFATVDRLST